jgi:hypothetical protein
MNAIACCNFFTPQFLRMTTGAKIEMKNCNILRNTQGSLSSEGTIYTYGNLMIENSCILENKATYIFYATSSGIITLSNCTVDGTGNTGSLIIQNTVTKSFILALNHLSTGNCETEYDVVGTLHCTIGRCLCQPQLSDVVSLTSILIFNFIHLYDSGDFWY